MTHHPCGKKEVREGAEGVRVGAVGAEGVGAEGVRAEGVREQREQCEWEPILCQCALCQSTHSTYGLPVYLLYASQHISLP